MDPLAKVEDYEARYGAVASDEQDVVETLLADASALILEAVEGSTKDWVTKDDVDAPRGVVYVCVSAVHRVLERGDGISREQLGDYSVSYDTGGPSSLFLTKHERRVVRKAGGLTSALSIELESPYSGPAAGNELDFSFPLEEEEN